MIFTLLLSGFQKVQLTGPMPSIFSPYATPPRRKSPSGIVRGSSKSSLSYIIPREAPVSNITGCLLRCSWSREDQQQASEMLRLRDLDELRSVHWVLLGYRKGVGNVRSDYSSTGLASDGSQTTVQKKESPTVSWADVVRMPPAGEAQGSSTKRNCFEGTIAHSLETIPWVRKKFYWLLTVALNINKPIRTAVHSERLPCTECGYFDNIVSREKERTANQHLI